MLKSIEAMERLKKKDTAVLKSEKWLLYLALTPERNINLERVHSLDDLTDGYVLGYVERTLLLLSRCDLDPKLMCLAEETQKWAEVAKGGMAHQRRQWVRDGIAVHVHNIGSAQIYERDSRESDPQRKRIIHDLIATHGLVGQYIRGEVPLEDSESLGFLVKENRLSAAELQKLLLCLNYCIISAVDERIWAEVSGEVKEAIGQIVSGQCRQPFPLRERLRKLRSVSARSGENFDAEYDLWMSDEKVLGEIAELLEHTELWYVEAALYDFSFEEFIKIFLLISHAVPGKTVRHISFERFMKDLYYQHDGKKRVNIYKKRIIEKYLSELSADSIRSGEFSPNPHVAHEILTDEFSKDTVFFTFHFSPAGSKLIDFCMEAEKSDVLYEQAIILLFDLFGLRKDTYDRFYEEEDYLNTMNQTIDFKSVLLEDIRGNRVIDIGPGGGALMDLIEEKFPDRKVMGVDISQNVLDSLKKKKQREHKNWEVLYGDALNLGQTIPMGGVDTIIFCSILHELYSYIEYEGKKFNHRTLEAALRSAFAVLPVGGRILIRDGIMTEPVDQTRIIRFQSEEGMDFLKRYAADFKGREISYTVVGRNEVRLPVNDAMEFLYTYTWGEQSYVHEVNEQFGYFTPTEYRNFISSVLGNGAKIMKFRHFLQDGYTLALSQKVEFFDGERNPVRLPDSTCIIVIEKIK